MDFIRCLILKLEGNGAMNLVNKEVIHETFGKGNITDHNDSYIKINFGSDEKKFVYPDVFKTYIKFTDKKANDHVEKIIEIKEEELKKEALLLEEEKQLEQERQDILEREKKLKDLKIHPEIQSVFWCKTEEIDEVFEEWKIFTGEIKSGKNAGQPRCFARMNQNSACLLTRRDEDMLEEDRTIIGLYMANESFNGRLCDDGYIEAHPEYRIQLSERESEKMLFWNYYIDDKFPKKTTWNSGRQRYFKNIWIAQILKDIIDLRENTEEQSDAQRFFEYFCKINLINKDELPSPEGSLLYT